MKNLTIAILLLFSITAKAQTAKQYQPDTAKVLPIHLNFSLQKLNDYIYVRQHGIQATTMSSQLSGLQITVMLQHYQTIVDSIEKPFTRFLIADKAKFDADQARQKQDSTKLNSKPLK